jgi:hypothetical protein
MFLFRNEYREVRNEYFHAEMNTGSQGMNISMPK